MAFIGNNLGSITTEIRTVDTMVGDGSTATLTLTKTPGSVNNVEVFYDGDEVITRLKDATTNGSYSDSLVPYVMFLDLNMPKMDGLEVLEVVRNDPKLKSMVIFVLTTSNNPIDIKKAYQQCIAGYLVKSEQGNRYEKLKDLVQSYSNAVTPPIEC